MAKLPTLPEPKLYDGWAAYFECPACHIPAEGYLSKTVACDHCGFLFKCIEPMDIKTTRHAFYNASLALDELLDPINRAMIKMDRWAANLAKKLRENLRV